MARLPGRSDETAGRAPQDRLFDLRPSLGRPRPRIPLAGRRRPTAPSGFSQAARRPDRGPVQGALPLLFVRAHQVRASALHAVAAVPRTVGVHSGRKFHQRLRRVAKHHPHRRTSRRVVAAHLHGGADAGSPGVTDSRYETDANRLWRGCVVSHRYRQFGKAREQDRLAAILGGAQGARGVSRDRRHRRGFEGRSRPPKERRHSS